MQGVVFGVEQEIANLSPANLAFIFDEAARGLEDILLKGRFAVVFLIIFFVRIDLASPPEPLFIRYELVKFVLLVPVVSFVKKHAWLCVDLKVVRLVKVNEFGG